VDALGSAAQPGVGASVDSPHTHTTHARTPHAPHAPEHVLHGLAQPLRPEEVARERGAAALHVHEHVHVGRMRAARAGCCGGGQLLRRRLVVVEDDDRRHALRERLREAVWAGVVEQERDAVRLCVLCVCV
jgi:hypothetical protein